MRQNPFTNKKSHRMSNQCSGKGGRTELLAVLAQTSGKMQEKVTSAQILRV